MIRSRLNDGVLCLTLARAEVLNALDIAHLSDLLKELSNARHNDDVRCVVLAAEGRAFCVGADIKAMDTMSDDEFAKAAELYQSITRAARALDQPILAAINGYALGGGLEIALIADVRIAAQSARLGLPDAQLGFSPTGGLTYLLNKLVGTGWAMHMAMTCEVLSADKALGIGLVTEVVEDHRLEIRAKQLAIQMASYPRVGIRNIKHGFNFAADADLAATLLLEAQYDSVCYADPDTRANLKAFIDARNKKRRKAE